jgi:hypothetical protein
VSLRFGYLCSKRVRIAEHIRPEDDPLSIRREAEIRLQAVIVPGRIDQFFGAEHAGSG